MQVASHAVLGKCTTWQGRLKARSWQGSRTSGPASEALDSACLRRPALLGFLVAARFWPASLTCSLLNIMSEASDVLWGFTPLPFSCSSALQSEGVRGCASGPTGMSPRDEPAHRFFPFVDCMAATCCSSFQAFAFSTTCFRSSAFRRSRSACTFEANRSRRVPASANKTVTESSFSANQQGTHKNVLSVLRTFLLAL